MAQPLSKFGDYFLIKKVATGGMAEIYLARTRTAQGPEKYVALKMIHPRYMEDGNFHNMILEEAKIAVQLNHKNVGQVFDLGQVDGRYFLVMEFVDGYDVSRLQDVTREKQLNIPVDITAFIGREVCAALSYAHQLKDRSGRHLQLIHRDISPQNILASFDGEVKIIDFGIAKVSTQLQQTQVGVIKGKFYYMSPEQAGAHDVDQRSDLFSLGICLWETLCGRSLFRREGGPTNPLAILHEIRTLPIPRVREIRPDCPKELDALIAKALSRDLTYRFQSAGEMQASFNRFMINHAPGFERQRLTNFMVKAFEKVETTKETQRITTKQADLMQRGDFVPTEHSIIYSLPTGQILTPHPLDVHSAETGMLDINPSRETNIFPGGMPDLPGIPMQPIAGMSETTTDRSLSVDYEERTTSRAIEMEDSGDLAMSETVYLRKDDVQAMRDAGEAPMVIDGSDILPALMPSDPHSETQSLASEDIQAAHAAYSARLRSDKANTSEVPRATPSRGRRDARDPDSPLTQHPLFRLLVIGVLVLCVLSATLALMLVRRGRERARLTNERERILKMEAPPPREAHNSAFLRD